MKDPVVTKVTNRLTGKKFVFKERTRSPDRAAMEKAAQWEILAFEMPFLKFPKDWEVSIIPPFGGASCRFRVRLSGKNKGKEISVYFDSEDALGSCKQPYWEAYPIGNDTERFILGEEERMILAIDKELRK